MCEQENLHYVITVGRCYERYDLAFHLTDEDSLYLDDGDVVTVCESTDQYCVGRYDGSQKWLDLALVGDY